MVFNGHYKQLYEMVRKFWEILGKSLGNPWETFGKPLGKTWEILGVDMLYKSKGVSQTTAHLVLCTDPYAGYVALMVIGVERLTP